MVFKHVVSGEEPPTQINFGRTHRIMIPQRHANRTREKKKQQQQQEYERQGTLITHTTW